MSNDLNEAKQRLIDKLGDNYNVYIQLLGKWFRGSLSKEEFDKNARQLIEQDFILEHNKFWLAFFHHCANNATNSAQSHGFQASNVMNKHYMSHNSFENQYGNNDLDYIPASASHLNQQSYIPGINKVRCLPSKMRTHMKIYVIAWEMGLDTASDNVSNYISTAVQHFLKNIITEVICTKTAYRLRENKFKYAIGVKPMNPYLSNSLRIYSSNLEYDPYQIESNKMNSSLVDTYVYNDSLFPSRLYEAQALYEYACSTTLVVPPENDKKPKRVKLSSNHDHHHNDDNHHHPAINHDSEMIIEDLNSECDLNIRNPIGLNNGSEVNAQVENQIDLTKQTTDLSQDSCSSSDKESVKQDADGRKLTLLHLLVAFLSNKSIIPSQSLYLINLERIFTKLSP